MFNCMGSGEHHNHIIKSLLSFLHHHHHHQDQDPSNQEDLIMRNNKGNNCVSHDIPKGCVAVMVGHEGEVQKRFVVPVNYMNHPLFMKLLKEAEEEYGFDHEGPINIPCHVEYFATVQGLIDREEGYNNHHHHHHHHHHLPVSWCFKA